MSGAAEPAPRRDRDHRRRDARRCDAVEPGVGGGRDLQRRRIRTAHRHHRGLGVRRHLRGERVRPAQGVQLHVRRGDVSAHDAAVVLGDRVGATQRAVDAPAACRPVGIGPRDDHRLQRPRSPVRRCGRRDHGRGVPPGHPDRDVVDDANCAGRVRPGGLRVDVVDVPRQQLHPAPKGRTVRRPAPDRGLGRVHGRTRRLVLVRRHPLPRRRCVRGGAVRGHTGSAGHERRERHADA